jgi:putative methyltransferase (TIGR04325 family)
LEIKTFIKKIILKIIEHVNRRIMRVISRENLLDYAPNGWETPVRGGGWNAVSVVEAEKANWQRFCLLLQSSGPLGFHHETRMSDTRNVLFHNINITYGYVLALAAHNKPKMSVLDYGGSLGHYYQIGKSLLPEVNLDFSCKEMPSVAEAGRQINPEIQWYTDDSCLARPYDLLMITSSLQYMQDWQGFIHDVANSVGEYFFLSRIPVSHTTETYVAVQRTLNTEMLLWIFNKQELEKVIEESGFVLVREFVLGDRHYVRNIPERCELVSWLFRKNAQTVSGI